jgi:hypothetical protein
MISRPKTMPAGSDTTEWVDYANYLEQRIHEAMEVYAGMEGFIPETAPEAYCLRIINQMNKALLGGEDECI